jgi:hypothetical protein
MSKLPFKLFIDQMQRDFWSGAAPVMPKQRERNGSVPKKLNQKFWNFLAF